MKFTSKKPINNMLAIALLIVLVGLIERLPV